MLRAAIYLAIVLGQAGEIDTALSMLRDARHTARQQGFSGLEAEAQLCEAMVRPLINESDRAVIIRCLQASITVASESGAKPLLLKAQTLLGTMLANSEDAESDLPDIRRT